MGGIREIPIQDEDHTFLSCCEFCHTLGVVTAQSDSRKDTFLIGVSTPTSHAHWSPHNDRRDGSEKGDVVTSSRVT